MGQRLNIQIEANDTDTNEIVVLANCYYHWSGYTTSAMENETMTWEESRVTINLTTGSINMSDMFYDETDVFSRADRETKLKNLYELKADLNSSFDTFQALYTELNDNIFKTSYECDMFVQEDCIYRLIE